MSSDLPQERSHLIVGKRGRLAAALLETATESFVNERIYNVSARNSQGDLISSNLIPTKTLNIIWSSGWAGARSDKKTCDEDFNLLSFFMDRLSDLKCDQLNFIFLSSGGTIYGNSPGLVTENSPVNPNSHYAEMKLKCEELLISYSDTNFTPLILRLANLYGSSLATYKTSLIDECIKNFQKRNQFSIFTNLASQKQYGTFQDYSISVLEATRLISNGVNPNRIINVFPPHLYAVKEILEATAKLFSINWHTLVGNSFENLPLETTILMNADGITQPSISWESLNSYLERVGL